jgi:hypothetical protein
MLHHVKLEAGQWGDHSVEIVMLETVSCSGIHLLRTLRQPMHSWTMSQTLQCERLNSSSNCFSDTRLSSRSMRPCHWRTGLMLFLIFTQSLAKPGTFPHLLDGHHHICTIHCHNPSRIFTCFVFFAHRNRKLARNSSLVLSFHQGCQTALRQRCIFYTGEDTCRLAVGPSCYDRLCYRNNIRKLTFWFTFVSLQ